LALATGHYGLQKTLQTFDDLIKEHDELERHLDNITADNTWRGVSVFRSVSSFVDIGDPQTPVQARVEAAIKQMKVAVFTRRPTQALTGIAI